MSVELKETKSRSIEVRVHYARDLPKTDVLGLCDPYVVLRAGDLPAVQTTVIKKTLNPSWEESLAVDNVPASADVRVELYDEDVGKVDDMLCSIVLTPADFPVVHRDFLVPGHAGAVLCLSAFAFPSAASSALALKSLREFSPRAGAVEWFAPVPGCDGIVAGLRYDGARPSPFVAHTTAESLAHSAARMAVKGGASFATKLETQFESGTTDLSRLPPIRRVGTLKDGWKVFGESTLLDPGRFPLADIVIRVAKKHSLVKSTKMSDVARAHQWPGMSTTFDQAKAPGTLTGAFFDDASQTIFLEEEGGKVIASMTCGYGTQKVAWFLTPAGRDAGMSVDFNHSSVNERIIEIADAKLDATHTAVAKVTIAKQPSILRIDQVFLNIYQDEDFIEIPFLSLFPI